MNYSNSVDTIHSISDSRTAVRIVTSIFLFLTLFISSYIRGVQIGQGFTTSYLLIILGGILSTIIIVNIIYAKRLILFNYLTLWIGLIMWLLISLALQLHTYSEKLLTLQFAAEFSLNLIIGLAFFSLIDRRLFNIIAQWFIASSALVGGTSLFFIFANSTVRRVGTGSTALPVAVNHLSHGLAIGAILAFTKLIIADNWKEHRLEITSIPLIFIGIILTGSRAAIIGIFLAIALFTVLSERISISHLGIGAGISILFVGLLQTLGIFIGGYRFSPIFIISSIVDRFEIYLQVIREVDLSASSIIFGGGMHRYGPIAPSDTAIIYPHNYFLSMFAHLGLPAMILFTVMCFGIIVKLSTRNAIVSNPRYLETATLGALVVILLYISTSGRLTRVFTIWIFLGIGTAALLSPPKGE